MSSAAAHQASSRAWIHRATTNRVVRPVPRTKAPAPSRRQATLTARATAASRSVDPVPAGSDRALAGWRPRVLGLRATGGEAIGRCSQVAAASWLRSRASQRCSQRWVHSGQSMSRETIPEERLKTRRRTGGDRARWRLFAETSPLHAVNVPRVASGGARGTNTALQAVNVPRTPTEATGGTFTARGHAKPVSPARSPMRRAGGRPVALGALLGPPSPGEIALGRIEELDAWVDRALEHPGALLSSDVDAQAPVLLDHLCALRARPYSPTLTRP
jgi:hypothetical protein